MLNFLLMFFCLVQTNSHPVSNFKNSLEYSRFGLVFGESGEYLIAASNSQLPTRCRILLTLGRLIWYALRRGSWTRLLVDGRPDEVDWSMDAREDRIFCSSDWFAAVVF